MKKRAQEEMVGFVIVMLVVAVIFLVFLSVYIRSNKGSQPTESIEISQFLDSIVETTSICSFDDEFTFLSIGDLIRECQKEPIRKCTNIPSTPTPDESEVCMVLASELEKSIEDSWNFGVDSPETGYRFLASFDSGIGASTNILNSPVSKPCGANVQIGADKPVFTPNGKIIISLTIC
jgi:hypothetical protein